VFKKSILTYLLIGWQVMLYAQTKQPQVFAGITFGSGPVCEVSADVCSMQTGTKSQHNTGFIYQPKTQELLVVLDKKQLNQDNKAKLYAIINTQQKLHRSDT